MNQKEKKNEIKKAMQHIEQITSFLKEPDNEEEYQSQKIYKIKLLISYMKSKQIISKEEEIEFKKKLIPLEYNIIISSKNFKKEKMEKVKISLLNNWIKLSNLNNTISFVDC